MQIRILSTLVYISAILCSSMSAPAPAGEAQNDVEGVQIEHDSVPWGVADFMCGPRCLWQIAHVYGKEYTLNNVAQMAGTDPQQGTTVSGMLQACKKMGIEAVPVKTNIRFLAEDPRVAILLLGTDDRNHFVILDRIDDNSVALLDGCMFRDIPIHELPSIWDGYAILIGDSQIRTTDWVQLGSGRALQVIGIAALLGTVVLGVKNTWRRARRVFLRSCA